MSHIYGPGPGSPFQIDPDLFQRLQDRQTYLREQENMREILKKLFPMGAAGVGTSTVGSVPTPKPVPEAGEDWWVKVPDKERLVKVYIISISNAMVVINSYNTIDLRGGNYERNYFKFVEKHVESLESKPA